ncbi:LruC domain-containing protein [Parabacteroides sp. PF5-6]|uniref:LruC domain-containing protein n=1 Tax=Parabacteroides sp. PF5-6 TaxID=1742403 RepID=UPI0024076F14|nr:LruC domain-containing protein [Parabacteroides sp. PF5-6]
MLKTLSLSLFSFLIVTVGCTDKDVYEPEPETPVIPEIPDTPSKDDYFDFSTTQKFTVDINYCLSDYSILFELFDKDPLIPMEGGFEKTKEEPLYRAITDKNGRFTGEITLPAYIKTVYLYANYVGVSQLVQLDVDTKSVSFNQDAYWQSLQSKGGVATRGATANGWKYPEGYKVLGDWNLDGSADYISQLGKRELDSDFMTRLNNTFVKKNVRKDPVYVGNGKSMDIHIVKPTKVYQIFLYTSAAYYNAYAYYSYPTNNPPKSKEQIKNKIISFPFIRTKDENFPCAITPGDQVQLMYWNEETNEFEEEFPAGVSIGFMNLANCYSKGNIEIKGRNSIEETQLPYTVDPIFYTNPVYNDKLAGVGKKDYQRTVAAYDGEQMIALCFEDHLGYDVDGPGWAWSYNDAIFYIHIEERDAIDPSLPGLPDDTKGPSEEDNYVNYYGTLAFEDLWPSQGDYDMNDMIVRYNSKVYRDASNRVTKIVDEIIPVHNGASYRNGFGYQFDNVAKEDIKSVTILSESGITSSFMQGVSLEPGQDKPTVVLFDNLSVALEQQAVFAVTTEFKNGVDESHVVPPYNPFIVVRTDTGRSREVHLTNYAPTSLMNMDLLGTVNDLSAPEYGIYYVSNNNFPFAINLYRDDTFTGATESRRIDTEFPRFTNWVATFGEEDADWYISEL